jgi:hypothetical protein
LDPNTVSPLLSQLQNAQEKVFLFFADEMSGIRALAIDSVGKAACGQRFDVHGEVVQARAQRRR